MALINGSVRRTAMFLLLANLFCPNLHAWNSDYAYGLPRQRRMCVLREGSELVFLATPADEACPVGAKRYVVVFGKEPRGSIGLLSFSTAEKFYPPLILKWPGKEETTTTHLWHFTCVEPKEVELLQSKIQLKRYKGEYTAKAEKDCIEVQDRALKFCQDEFQGSELLESCPLSWGVE